MPSIVLDRRSTTVFFFPLIPLTFVILGLPNHRNARPAGRAASGTVGRPTPGTYRVSNAERDIVVDELRRHAVDGRLSMDEFGDRAEVALGAVTADELLATLRDLPATRSTMPERTSRVESVAMRGVPPLA